MSLRRLPLAALVLCACAPEAPVAVRSDEPAVYVVLTRDPLAPADPYFPDDARLTAVVATTGVPWEFEFRDAERFEMRRASDGRRFAWVAVPTARGGGFAGRGAVPYRGNYALEEEATDSGLGRRDLQAGERYLLTIDTEGRTITGTAVIPEQPRPVVVRRSPATVIAWPRAAGAALYLVTYGHVQWQPASADTSHVLPRLEGPQPLEVRVMAVDANWAAFFRDPSLTAAGIAGGNGLFGATAEARLQLGP